MPRASVPLGNEALQHLLKTHHFYFALKMYGNWRNAEISRKNCNKEFAEVSAEIDKVKAEIRKDEIRYRVIAKEGGIKLKWFELDDQGSPQC